MSPTPPSAASAAAPAEDGGQLVWLYEKQKKVYARAVSGWFTNWRWALVWATQLVFYGVPWLPWNDRQAVLFDLASRRFYLGGLVLYPQDFIYLTGLLVVSAYSLFLFTAVAGRLWCGYACPQTVYSEMFMWIERMLEGDRNARIRLDAAPWSAQKLLKKGTKQALWIARLRRRSVPKRRRGMTPQPSKRPGKSCSVRALFEESVCCLPRGSGVVPDERLLAGPEHLAIGHAGCFHRLAVDELGTEAGRAIRLQRLGHLARGGVAIRHPGIRHVAGVRDGELDFHERLLDLIVGQLAVAGARQRHRIVDPHGEAQRRLSGRSLHCTGRDQLGGVPIHRQRLLGPVRGWLDAGAHLPGFALVLRRVEQHLVVIRHERVAIARHRHDEHAVGRSAVHEPEAVGRAPHGERAVERQRVGGPRAVALGGDDSHLTKRCEAFAEQRDPGGKVADRSRSGCASGGAGFYPVASAFEADQMAAPRLRWIKRARAKTRNLTANGLKKAWGRGKVLGRKPEEWQDARLAGVIRESARQLLARGVEAEVRHFREAIARPANGNGRDPLVRNGLHPARTVMTGVGR